MLNIEYSSSNAYFKYMYISIKSLLSFNTDMNFCFHIFYEDLSKENMDILKEYVTKSGNNICFYNINDYLEIINKVFSHGFKLAYVKIILSKILKCDTVLHLGADTLIRGSLKDLENYDFNGKYVAGVQDTMLWHDRKKIELKKDDYYINSDITLHNLKAQREVNIYENYVLCLKHFNNHVTYCEQGMLNYVCQKQIALLPVKYCVMPPSLYFKSEQIKKLYKLSFYYEQDELDKLFDDTVIVHFTNGFYGKPWYKECKNPFAKEFLKYNVDDSKFDLLDGIGMNKNAMKMARIFNKYPFFIFYLYFRLVDFYRSKIKNKER